MRRTPTPGPTAAEISKRLTVINQKIEAAGGALAGPDAVQLVAITKTFDTDLVRAAVEAGLKDLGENYAQELTAKATAATAPEGIRWHFVGGLQRNKVKKLASDVWLWQTIDRTELALELSKRVPGARVLIQVNTTGEAQKSGCDPTEAAKVVSLTQDLGLDVLGLMTLGPTSAEVDPRPSFSQCRSLADGLGLKVVSMGMSGDFEMAVSEGSTMVRVGSSLFGHRHRG